MENSDIVYGKNAVEALFNEAKTSRINKILVSQNGKKDLKILNIMKLAKENKIPVQEVPKEKLQTYTKESHQGIVALVAPIEYASLENVLLNLPADKNNLIIILDNVQDPHNLGAIIRSAKCAGASAVIIPKRGGSPVTPTVEKCSAGAVSLIPIVQVTNINNAIDKLKEANFWIYGAEASGSEIYHKMQYNSNTAFVMGGEDEGISRLTAQKCDVLVKIPMGSTFNSLNVSNAAAILMFEFLRQQNF